MITASMSTIAWREPGLARAVASILPQVDRLNVFLQQYDHTPACLDHPRVCIVRDTQAPESAALGASAKYHWHWNGLIADGYHFLVDDDIEYPPDYAQLCIRKIEEYGRRPVVGFHGARYKPQVAHYLRDRQCWQFDRACDDDHFVHMLGTGTTAYHTSAIRLRRQDFEKPNSCDLYLAIAAQRQHVPMLCVARPDGYLKALPLATDSRAVSAPQEYADRMAQIHATMTSWEINPAVRVRPPWAPVVVVVPCYNEPTERIERTVESALATPGVDVVRVVDDGSGVPVSLLPRDRLEVLRCMRNGGPSAALNAGIRSLPDDAIICRLDVGDVFYPDAKARQIEMVKAGAPAVCSWRYDPVAGEVREIKPGWDRGIFKDCQFSATATVFTKRVWLECGGFDESLRWADDWRFSMLVQFYVGWTPMHEATGEHGMHPGGHSDVSGHPARAASRSRDVAKVTALANAMGNPRASAHLFNERWCKKRGIEPLRMPGKK